MSQITTNINSIGPAGPLLTLTGNSGGAVPPDGGGNINILGSGDIDVAGNAGTNTLTISLTTPASSVNFSSYKSADTANVTGDGTGYTVLFDTVIANVGAAYNSGTGIFTAPTTGLYHFSAGITSYNYTFDHTGYQLLLFGSVYHVSGSDINPGVVFDGIGANDVSQSVSSSVNMTAGDTMQVILQVDGGTKTIGIHGTPAPDLFTWFNGYRIA